MAEQMSVGLFRTRLGERIPRGKTEADTLFSDNELQEILDRAADNEYRALADGWSTKAGLLAEMIDTNESGSERKYSKLYDQAFKMWQQFEKAAIDFAADMLTGVRSSGAQGFDAFCSEEDKPVVTIFPRWAYGMDHGVYYDSKPVYPVERGLP